MIDFNAFVEAARTAMPSCIVGLGWTSGQISPDGKSSLTDAMVDEMIKKVITIIPRLSRSYCLIESYRYRHPSMSLQHCVSP